MIRSAASLLVIVPAIVVAILIYIYGGNLPYWDQWEEYDLFHLVQQHSLTIQDLFAQHNEHRLFFPRLLLISATIFAPNTDWAELWISWTLACLSSLCLWRLSRYTGWSGMKGLLLLTGANILLFNVLAWEDWLWGFQIGFLLPGLCVIAGAWSVSASRGAWQFFWAAWWSTINTFTIASGFTTWIVLTPLLIFPGGKLQFRWQGLLVHFLGFGLCLFLYLHSYVKPSGHPSTSTILTEPWDALNYFLLYVGAPLADSGTSSDDLATWACTIFGALFVCLYVACLALLFWHRRESRILNRTLPWLTLVHYGLFTAIITSIGRMGFGLAQALSSRYVILSSLVPIGLLFTGACLFSVFVHDLKAKRFRQFLYVSFVALPVLCLGFYMWTATKALSRWRDISQNQTRTKAALVFINLPSAAPLLTQSGWAYPNFPMLKHFFDERTALGYPQEILADSHIAPLVEHSAPEPLSGSFGPTPEDSTGHSLAGWAFLSKAHRCADLILITLPDSQNQDSIIGIAYPVGYDETAGEKAKCSGDTPLKWTITLPADANLNGMKAWSFDGVNCRAYQIPYVDERKKA